MASTFKIDDDLTSLFHDDPDFPEFFDQIFGWLYRRTTFFLNENDNLVHKEVVMRGFYKYVNLAMDDKKTQSVGAKQKDKEPKIVKDTIVKIYQDKLEQEKNADFLKNLATAGKEHKDEKDLSKINVRALYDFEAQTGSGELTISANEILTVTNQDVREGWWEGVNSKGLKGLFPAGYVETYKNGLEPGKSAENLSLKDSHTDQKIKDKDSSEPNEIEVDESILKSLFELYAKVSEPGNDGSKIGLTNLNRWFVQSGILKNKKLQIERADLGVEYSAITKTRGRMNFGNFKLFIMNLAKKSTVDANTLASLLVAAGKPDLQKDSFQNVDEQDSEYEDDMKDKEDSKDADNEHDSEDEDDMKDKEDSKDADNEAVKGEKPDDLMRRYQ